MLHSLLTRQQTDKETCFRDKTWQKYDYVWGSEVVVVLWGENPASEKHPSIAKWREHCRLRPLRPFSPLQRMGHDRSLSQMLKGKGGGRGGESVEAKQKWQSKAGVWMVALCWPINTEKKSFFTEWKQWKCLFEKLFLLLRRTDFIYVKAVSPWKEVSMAGWLHGWGSGRDTWLRCERVSPHTPDIKVSGLRVPSSRLVLL